jgi:hypothetical protein
VPVEKAQKDIAALVGQVASGEIKLPEIQRAYVWKPTQVARLIESLYRGYPSGSLLFWRTSETPETRSVSANAPTANPAVLPLYLLDGQQRLTSLHRVLDDHDEAQIVFNVETEAFQNHSAATRKDPRWIKVFDLTRSGANLLATYSKITKLGPPISDDEIGERLQRLAAIPRYEYHLEIITGLPYEEVAQIFVRVNSGGRALKTTDLALATLSARWPGILGKLETEAAYWRQRGYGDLDVTFLTRALTGAVLGRGLSAWSHSRLAAATDEELEAGWTTVRKGLHTLVPLLKNNLKVGHSSLLTSINVLLPLVVLLGERPKEKLEAETANGIVYWFLIATVRTRYSSSADTLLGQDIPAVRKPDPITGLMANLGIGGARIEIPPQALVGRTVGSPYFFLSFLVAQENGAKDWFHGAGISADAEGDHKIEYHHIHPRATLKATYPKAEINDLANLAFISATANRKISDQSPSVYFPSLDVEELTAHFVPLDSDLRTADAYPRFLAARRELLAEAMTRLLDQFRPAWLDCVTPAPADDIEGCSLQFTRYESDWDEPKMIVEAAAGDGRWRAVFSATAFDEAITQARDGISGDLDVAGHQLTVRSDNDLVELELGPLLAFGTGADWQAVVDRERSDALPLSQLPTLPEASPWDGPQRRFPVASSE